MSTFEDKFRAALDAQWGEEILWVNRVEILFDSETPRIIVDYLTSERDICTIEMSDERARTFFSLLFTPEAQK